MTFGIRPATLLAIQGVHHAPFRLHWGWENLSTLNRFTHFVEEQRQAVANPMDSILTSVAVNSEDAKPN
jgi:hypothetical protein